MLVSSPQPTKELNVAFNSRLPHSFAQLLTLHIGNTINQIYNYYQVKEKHIIALYTQICG